MTPLAGPVIVLAVMVVLLTLGVLSLKDDRNELVRRLNALESPPEEPECCPTCGQELEAE